MLTINSIREDLKDIRYYYSRKDVFEKLGKNIVGDNAILGKIEMYNKAIRTASPKLCDIYISLYIDNQTQESLAEHLGYAVEYISRLNSKLVRFLLKEFQKEENVDE